MRNKWKIGKMGKDTEEMGSNIKGGEKDILLNLFRILNRNMIFLHTPMLNSKETTPTNNYSSASMPNRNNKLHRPTSSQQRFELSFRPYLS